MKKLTAGICTASMLLTLGCGASAAELTTMQNMDALPPVQEMMSQPGQEAWEALDSSAKEEIYALFDALYSTQQEIISKQAELGLMEEEQAEMQLERLTQQMEQLRTEGRMPQLSQNMGRQFGDMGAGRENAPGFGQPREDSEQPSDIS